MNKRSFLKYMGLGAGLLPIIGMGRIRPGSLPPNTTLFPKPLKKGDMVGIISPSAASAEKILIQFAREAMEALGFHVKESKNLYNRRGHLAGTDQERADDLNSMFADQEIKAIICVRGGSGAARILPLIDYENIKRNPKPILGYSDITALHSAIFSQTGLITFHGPNGMGSWNSFNVSQFEKIFFEQKQIRFENEQVKGDDLIIRQNRIQTIYPGKAEGVIVGGNLTVLTAIAGSPYFPDLSDKILFLEDIGEEPYRIDRMMSTLMLTGGLSRIKGFIFGQCTDCSPTGGFGSLNLDEIFDDYILPLKIPAYRGAMIGHVPKQFIIPIGAEVSMDADLGIIDLKQNLFA